MSKSNDMMNRLKAKRDHHQKMVESLDQAIELLGSIEEMLDGPRTVASTETPTNGNTRGPRGSYKRRKGKIAWGKIIRELIEKEGEMSREYLQERLETLHGLAPVKKNRKIVHRAVENLVYNNRLNLVKYNNDPSGDMLSAV